MKIIYEAEVRRLLFIINRDGLEEAITFASRGLKTYRTCVLRPRRKYGDNSSHLSIAPYKKYAILSYLQYKDFLKNPSTYL